MLRSVKLLSATRRSRVNPSDLIKWRIERLASSHERSSFHCGESSLDEFLQRLASQYERKDICRTFVAVTGEHAVVQGYYSLSTGSVSYPTLPVETSRKLPRHPVPVAHLGRLAVDKKAQEKGLGAILLIDALKRCIQFSEQIGVFAVEVHALNDNARRFYVHFGFVELTDDPLHLYLPMRQVRKLFP
ncbi:MAG TPA: GNAT family N-acetyltransferase [Gemmataceae bacterium]|nr:GNAT family N-acetyltransferase [Gemmataceae bacterium]